MIPFPFTRILVIHISRRQRPVDKEGLNIAVQSTKYVFFFQIFFWLVHVDYSFNILKT
jgi:hypothetical protein